MPRPVLLAMARAVQITGLGAPRVEFTVWDVAVNDLPEELQGFTIGQVSDIHAGERAWSPQHAEEAADMLVQANPDLLVNTGDFVQWEPDIVAATETTRRFVLPPSETRAVPRSIAILGNHDYYPGDRYAGDLFRHLSGLGYHMLENEAVAVRAGTSSLSVVGIVHDTAGVERGIEALLDAPRPRLALVHEPETAESLPHASADLILAGHTHGGQITLPGLERTIVRRFAQSNYVDGWYRVGGMPLYVNRGLGCTGFPFRFRARPEVTLIRLVR